MVLKKKKKKKKQSSWTLPYIFGSEEVGISVVKRALGGDWNSSAPTMGVWAADYSLNFLSDFMSKFGVADAILLFTMNSSGTLLSSNKNLSTMIDARQVWGKKKIINPPLHNNNNNLQKKKKKKKKKNSRAIN